MPLENRAANTALASAATNASDELTSASGRIAGLNAVLRALFTTISSSGDGAELHDMDLIAGIAEITRLIGETADELPDLIEAATEGGAQ